MRRFTLILLLTLLHTLAYSQIVKGRIIDIQTRESVPFAAVYFAGTFLGTTSDQDGNFQIDVTSFVSMPLTISAIGYYSYTLSDFSIGQPIVILLTPKVYEIGEVEINGNAVARRRRAMLKVFRKEFLVYPESLVILYAGKWSQINFKSKYVYFARDGYFNPKGIGWEGELGKKRIGDSLPYEYTLSQ